MAEVTNEMIYEVVKAMQPHTGNVEEIVRDILYECRMFHSNIQTASTPLGAIQTAISNIYQEPMLEDKNPPHPEERPFGTRLEGWATASISLSSFETPLSAAPQDEGVDSHARR